MKLFALFLNCRTNSHHRLTYHCTHINAFYRSTAIASLQYGPIQIVDSTFQPGGGGSFTLPPYAGNYEVIVPWRNPVMMSLYVPPPIYGKVVEGEHTRYNSLYKQQRLIVLLMRLIFLKHFLYLFYFFFVQTFSIGVNKARKLWRRSRPLSPFSSHPAKS